MLDSKIHEGNFPLGKQKKKILSANHVSSEYVRMINFRALFKNPSVKKYIFADKINYRAISNLPSWPKLDRFRLKLLVKIIINRFFCQYNCRLDKLGLFLLKLDPAPDKCVRHLSK